MTSRLRTGPHCCDGWLRHSPYEVCNLVCVELSVARFFAQRFVASDLEFGSKVTESPFFDGAIFSSAWQAPITLPKGKNLVALFFYRRVHVFTEVLYSRWFHAAIRGSVAPRALSRRGRCPAEVIIALRGNAHDGSHNGFS